MSRVAMGGTFDVLHRGHRALLETAFTAGDEGVEIGLTTDAFANASRTRTVRHYSERLADLEAYLRSRGWGERGLVRPIETPIGFALEPRFTHVVVTQETARSGDLINAERAQRGLPPLQVVVAPYVLADDARPIKSTRVVAGEIDAEGHLKRPVRIAVGSDNPVKVEATRRAALRLFGECDVRGFAVDTGVPLQPYEDATWVGASTRARAALTAWPEADFGVGIEAGLFDVRGVALVFDVQACVIVDHAGRATHGQGPGFSYPASVVDELRAGRTVGDVIAQRSGVPDVGKKTGAVGWLSRGHFTRTALTEPAVLMAFLPRLRSDLYGL